MINVEVKVSSLPDIQILFIPRTYSLENNRYQVKSVKKITLEE